MWVWKTNRNNSPGQQVVPNEFWSIQDTFCSFQRSISRLVPGISRLLNSLYCYQSTDCVTSRLLNSLDRHQSTALCNQSTDQLSGHASVDYSAGPVDYSAPISHHQSSVLHLQLTTLHATFT